MLLVAHHRVCPVNVVFYPVMLSCMWIQNWLYPHWKVRNNITSKTSLLRSSVCRLMVIHSTFPADWPQREETWKQSFLNQKLQRDSRKVMKLKKTWWNLLPDSTLTILRPSFALPDWQDYETSCSWICFFLETQLRDSTSHKLHL